MTSAAETKTTSDTPIIKRGRGRPRKYPVPIPGKTLGVVLKPQTLPDDSTIAIEFVDANCSDIKKVLTHIKFTQSSLVEFTFTRTKLIIRAKSATDIYSEAVFDCTKVNSYYCTKEFTKCMANEVFCDVMRPLDAKYSSVMLIAKTTTFEHEINIVYCGGVGRHCDETRTAKWSSEKFTCTFPDSDISAHDATFSLTGTYLKKMVNDIGKISDKFSINCQPTGLEIRHSGKDHNMSAVYRMQKEHHQFKLNKAKDMHKDIPVAYIKPFSTSIMPETVIVYIFEDKVIFTGQLGTAITAKLIIPIHDRQSVLTTSDEKKLADAATASASILTVITPNDLGLDGIKFDNLASIQLDDDLDDDVAADEDDDGGDNTDPFDDD
jgi:hypothetical protein